MAAYSSVSASAKDAESPVNVDLIEKLDQNPLAMFEGAAGAPRLQNAAFNDNTINAARLLNGSIAESKMANNAVSQRVIAANSVGTSELRTGNTGNVGGVLWYTSSAIRTQDYVSPGGVFAFGVTVEKTAGSGSAYGWEGGMVSSPPAGHINALRLKVEGLPAGGNATIYGRQYYVASSPPIDIGDGESGLFVYVLMRGGAPVGFYSADVPPWLYNGPTSVVSNYKDNSGKKKKLEKTLDMSTGEVTEEVIEITDTVKNADMNLIPHPFLSKEPGDTVVLLDPCQTHGLLDVQSAGENIAELIRNDYLKIDNSPLKRAAIAGVSQVDFSWRNTGKKPARKALR